MKQKLFYLILLVTLSCLVVGWGFADIIRHPNGFLLGNSGDALNGYYVFCYYLKYGHGFHFPGANYPYGEHLLYLDIHPLYVWLLNLVDDHIYPIRNYGVAIVNISMLLGMVVGSVMIYILLRHYRTPGWYALPLAMGIMLLSPQWSRLHGHLSLSYSFIIPAVWYLIIRSLESFRWYWSALLLAFMLMIGGIHLYHLAMCSSFILSLVFIKVVRPGRPFEKLRKYGPLFLAAVLPLVFFLLLSDLTDPVDDRPVSPYGFFRYFATPASVFMPPSGAFNFIIQSFFQPIYEWEGRAFVGSATIIGLVLFLMVSLIRKVDRTALLPKVSSEQVDFFLAAFIVLLFSMCIPFKYGIFSGLADLVSPVKQFRSLGRFSWVFFYVGSIVAALHFYQIYSWLRKKELGAWVHLVPLFVMTTFLVEGFENFLHTANRPLLRNDKLESVSASYLDRFTESGKQVHDFQGILPLPVVAVRTDKMHLGHDFSGLVESMKCAYHTGLGFTPSIASRPAFSQAHSNIQLLGGPLVQKPRLQDFDQKPLLIIKTRDSKLNEEEIRLFSKATTFWSDDYITMSELPVSAFIDSTEWYLERAEEVLPPQVSSIACYPNCDNVTFADFESGARTSNIGVALEGNHAFHSEGDMVVLDTTLTSGNLEASFWVYIDPSYDGMPVLEYLSGKGLSDLRSHGIQSIRANTAIYKNWVRVHQSLTSDEHHRIILYGKDISIDNLMIKPVNKNVFIKTPRGIALYNNFVLD